MLPRVNNTPFFPSPLLYTLRVAPSFLPELMSMGTHPTAAAAAMARRSGSGGGGRRRRGIKRGAVQQHLVLRKLRRLKRLVPGCGQAAMEVLLRRTAEYISMLELRVVVLRSVLNLHGM